MSKTKTRKLIVGVVVGILFFTAVSHEKTVHAGGGDTPWFWDLYRISSQTTAGETHIDSAGTLVGSVQTYVFGIVLTITFITLILSGIKFGLARGDIKALMEAKRSLLYSIVAFVLAAGAFFLRRTLLNSLGAPDMGPTRNIK